MANMSYCRFQNTARDLRDCLEHFCVDDLSPEEEEARLRLVKYAQQIIVEARLDGLIQPEDE